jgi:hypothetical protein
LQAAREGRKIFAFIREGETMKRLQAVTVTFALACVPGLAFAQEAPDQYDDTAATASATVEYDGGQGVDSQGRRVDGDERYDERYEDRRYGGGGERYDDRDDRYAREDDRNYDRDRRYAGDCRRKPDRATPVLGFILGGLIGNQFGHGAGRAAMTAVGAHLGHEVARDAVNNCEDRYGYGYRGRGYGPGVGFGIGIYAGGYRSGYSLSMGAPFGYGYGYPGEYWRYRYHASPWRWGHRY